MGGSTLSAVPPPAQLQRIRAACPLPPTTTAITTPTNDAVDHAAASVAVLGGGDDPEGFVHCRGQE